MERNSELGVESEDFDMLQALDLRSVAVVAVAAAAVVVVLQLTWVTQESPASRPRQGENRLLASDLSDELSLRGTESPH